MQLRSLEHKPKRDVQRRILIVDDEPSIRQLVRQSLESEGYDIREAPNGSQVKSVEITSRWSLERVASDSASHACGQKSEKSILGFSVPWG